MAGISPRPIDFLLLWLRASGTDEGHPQANAIYAKARPGSGMAPGLLLENNLLNLSINQTWNTYGLFGMFYSVGPLATAGKGIIGLENFFPCFPKSSLLQECKRHSGIHSFWAFISSQKNPCLPVSPWIIPLWKHTKHRVLLLHRDYTRRLQWPGEVVSRGCPADKAENFGLWGEFPLTLKKTVEVTRVTTITQSR